MPTITGTGAGTLSDDIGSGTADVITSFLVPAGRILLYRTTVEEILALSDLIYTVSEAAGPAVITFTRTNARGAKTLPFSIIVQPGTAVQNINYTAPPLSYVFASGESVVDAPINILNTHMGLGVNKTFTVRTGLPPNKNSYRRGPVSESVVTITGVA